MEQGGFIDPENTSLNGEEDNTHGNDEALMRTGKLFGGLILDLKRKKK